MEREIKKKLNLRLLFANFIDMTSVMRPLGQQILPLMNVKVLVGRSPSRRFPGFDMGTVQLINLFETQSLDLRDRKVYVNVSEDEHSEEYQ